MKTLVLVFSICVLRGFVEAQPSHLELSSFGWLSGCWEARYTSGRIVSEQWMRPLGNTMMGMSRTVKDGSTIDFEFLRLVFSVDSTISYVAYPFGQSETAFKLVTLEGTRAVFENPDHDYPQRVIYHLISPDSIAARIEGTAKGVDKHFDFPFRKIKCE